jgi:NTE family protein
MGRIAESVTYSLVLMSALFVQYPKRRQLLALVSSAVAIAGCATTPGDYTASDAPIHDPALNQPRRSPALAVVLGGGGPRGFAHIGVIKSFEAAGLEPELIVGASVGAMIGALYANRMTAAELERMALDLDVTDFLRLGGERGFTGNPRAIERFVNERLDRKPIEALPRRFAATAVDVSKARVVTLNRGNAGVAVRASAALPGSFPAARILGVDYVDGDELAPVPCQSARMMGAQVVVAVDVSAHLASTPTEAPESWKVRDRRRSAAIARDLAYANIHVHPDLGYYADIRDAYRRKCIALGEAAGIKAIPAIRAALAAAT